VRLNAGELVEEDAKILSALGNLKAQQLLHREAVGEVVGHGAEIVDAVGERDYLLVKLGLAGLLDAGVEITDIRGEGDHGLAIDLDHEAKHAVGRRMLRAHIDDHGLVGGRCVPVIAGSVGDYIFDAGVDRGGASQFFNGGCH